MLSKDQVREVAALTSTCLATIPAGQEAAVAGRSMSTLCAQVQSRFGWDGVYEVAHAAAMIVTDGLRRIPESPFGYVGSQQPDGDWQYPDTVAGYAVRHFATAVIRADPAAARAAFDGLQPDQAAGDRPTAGMAEFLGLILLRGWSRQAGGQLEVKLGPGSRWPPVCDFCCGPPAVAMFAAAPMDPIELDRGSDSMGVGTISFGNGEDEWWYACWVCRPMVEAAPPRWADVMRRLRGDKADPAAVRVMLDAFQEARLTRRAVPLPATRPVPGQARRAG
jgi:hypothetical protein